MKDESEAWRSRYLALIGRLRLTCPLCKSENSHDMGCPLIGEGIDAFDIEVIKPEGFREPTPGIGRDLGT